MARPTVGDLIPFLKLGETLTTAYRGDRGKTAYDHSGVTTGNPHSVTKTDVGLANVTNDKQALYKNSTGTFTSGTSHQVNDAFITSDTAVTVAPTGTPAGSWVVDSYSGYFVITSDATESSVTFDWWAIK